MPDVPDVLFALLLGAGLLLMLTAAVRELQDIRDAD